MKKELKDVVIFPLGKINKEINEISSTMKREWLILDILGLMFRSVSFIVVFNAIKTVKNLIEKIKSASITLASSSEELSAVVRQVSPSLNVKTEKTAQIASSIEEMSVTTADIAKSIADLLDESKKPANIVKEGESHTLKTVSEVKVIKRTTEDLKEVMIKLEDKAKAIESVIEFIKRILPNRQTSSCSQYND